MTKIANPTQSDEWNGEKGIRWVNGADERDHVLAPVGDALMAAADLAPGTDVLDVGCGCGATTIRAATIVGDTGSATGIDLSLPMLEHARHRAGSASLTNTSFVSGDAQTHMFSADSVDIVIGRFGTMFFADPVAAFTNIRTAIRPGGRLALATWQPLLANEWLTVPGAALLNHATMPPRSDDGPGMFAQSDPDTVTAILSAAGFEAIALEATEVSFTLGRTVEDAINYLVDSGPGRVLLDTIPAGPARDAAIADVREVLAGHVVGPGVQLRGGIWLITARRPIH